MASADQDSHAELDTSRVSDAELDGWISEIKTFFARKRQEIRSLAESFGKEAPAQDQTHGAVQADTAVTPSEAGSFETVDRLSLLKQQLEQRLQGDTRGTSEVESSHE
jgi:hypothetical protein